MLNYSPNISALHILHYDIKGCLIIEETVKFYDIWMIKKHLNLYLCYELIYHIFYLLFWNLLDSYKHFCSLMNCNKDFPKSSFTFTFTYLKVIQRYFTPFSIFSYIFTFLAFLIFVIKLFIILLRWISNCVLKMIVGIVFLL